MTLVWGGGVSNKGRYLVRPWKAVLVFLYPVQDAADTTTDANVALEMLLSNSRNLPYGRDGRTDAVGRTDTAAFLPAAFHVECMPQMPPPHSMLDAVAFLQSWQDLRFCFSC